MTAGVGSHQHEAIDQYLSKTFPEIVFSSFDPLGADFCESENIFFLNFEMCDCKKAFDNFYSYGLSKQIPL